MNGTRRGMRYGAPPHHVGLPRPLPHRRVLACPSHGSEYMHLSPTSSPTPSRPRTLRSRLARSLAILAASALLVPAFVSHVATPADAATPVAVTKTFTYSSAGWTTTRAPAAAKSNLYWLSMTYGADAGYLKFPTAALPDNAKVTSATLKLNVRSTAATKGGVLVYPTSANWSPQTLSLKKHPARTGGAMNKSLVRAVAGKTITVPLTRGLDKISTTGTTSLELRYSQRAVGTVVNLASAAPTLKVTYTVPAPAKGGTPTATPAPKPTASAQPTTPAPTASAKPSPAPSASAQPSPAPSAAPTTPAPQPSTAPAPAPVKTTEANPPTAARPSIPAAASVGSKDLPFPVPGVNSTTKRVFAHYFPPYPISFENGNPDSDYYDRNYLTPDGEQGKHNAYSGLLRDRPEKRAPLSGDWKTKDFTTEINDAVASGVDGFMVDILSLSGGNWERTVGLTEAAAGRSDGFTVIPNIDATAGVANSSPTVIADAIAPLMKSKAAYKLSDGRVLLSSFKAEGKSAAWWKELIAALKSRHGISAAFTAVFLNASEANLRSFAPFTYAASVWGMRSPDSVRAAPNRAPLAQSLGMKWIEPIAVQDVRHQSGLYAEAGNTETIRATWKRAIDNGADFAQLITWNDYSEATSFARSEMHGTAFLDVSAYYASWFKSGKAPSLRGDELILTHRTQFASTAAALPPKTLSPTLGGNTGKPRDTVEVVAILKQAATLTITVGTGTQTIKAYTIDAPAGVSAHTVPLQVGQVSVTATRSGTRIAAAISDEIVVASPKVNNLLYAGATSRD